MKTDEKKKKGTNNMRNNTQKKKERETIGRECARGMIIQGRVPQTFGVSWRCAAGRSPTNLGNRDWSCDMHKPRLIAREKRDEGKENIVFILVEAQP